jgi:hypothetical protein
MVSKATDGFDPTSTVTPSNVLSGNIMAGASWNSTNTALQDALTQATGQQTQNFAVPGSTTSDTLKQLNDFIGGGGSFGADTTVFLQAGGVDFLNGVDKGTIKDNLNSIVSTLGSQGVKVVLTGSPYATSIADVQNNNFNPEVDPLYKDVASANKNVALVDTMGNILQNKSLLKDALHTNEVGTQQYNADVLAALASMNSSQIGAQKIAPTVQSAQLLDAAQTSAVTPTMSTAQAISAANQYAQANNVDLTGNINSWIDQHPGASADQVNAEMAKYGISQGDVARAVASRSDLNANNPLLVGNTYYQPQYDSTGSGMDAQQGPLSNLLAYTQEQNKVGGAYNQYDAQGNLVRTGTQQKVDNNMLPFLLAAGGMALGIPGLGLGEAATTGLAAGATSGAAAGAATIAGTGMTLAELAQLDLALGGAGGTAGALELANALGGTAAVASAAEAINGMGGGTGLTQGGNTALSSMGGGTGLTAANAANLDLMGGAQGLTTAGAGGGILGATGLNTGLGVLGGSTLGSTLAGLNTGVTGGLTGGVTGMGTGTGITTGAAGLGLNAGTAGLGADGLGAGITAGTGLTGTGVLTGSTLGESLLGSSALNNLTGTGVLTGSGLGTSLLGTGGGTGLTGTGVLTGSGLGTSLLGTGAGSAVTGGLGGSGTLLGTGAGLATGAGAGLAAGAGAGLGSALGTSLGTGLGLSALGSGLGAVANQAGITDARNLINQYGAQAGTALANAYKNAQNLNAANRTDLGNVYQNLSGNLNNTINAQSGIYGQTNANLANNYANTAGNLQNLYNQQVGYQAPYQQIGAQGAAGLAANQDYLTRQFNANDLNTNLAPNYAFQLQQGQMANQRAANAAGGSLGGNALQGLQRYTQDYAGGAYQQAFNNYNTQRNNIYNSLAGMANIGTTSAGQLAGLGNQYGSNMGSLSSTYGGNMLGNAGQLQGAYNQYGGNLTNAANTFGGNLTTSYGQGIGAANAYGLNTAGLATGLGSALASNATQSGANTSSLLSNLGNTALLGSMLKAT